MKKLALFLMLFALGAFPVLAAAADFNNVPVVDVSCSRKVAANPDAHTRSCALACAKSGYGIFTGDHQFLKFDAAGNREFVKEIENSSKKDHLRVDVSGEVQGGTLKVSSIKLL